MRKLAAGIAAALLVAGIPARAQIGGDGYQFIKAVKDRDVLKARGIVDRPGSTVVNTKDTDSGSTGLHLVTRDRDLGWMQFLLQEGADVNARDRAGATPLIAATEQRFVDGAKLLLALKADVNIARRDGQTALIVATLANDSSLSRLLVENGANPDTTDNVGRSARDYAHEDRRLGAVARILDEAKPGAAAQSAASFSIAPKRPASPEAPPPPPKP